MDFEFAERAAVERVQEAMQMSTQFVIEAGEELCDLLLGDRGGQVDIPDVETGKGLRVA